MTDRQLDKLNTLIAKQANTKGVLGTVFAVKPENEREASVFATGNLTPEGTWYVASINKFVVSAVVLKLCADGKLSLNDNILKYLPDSAAGLHIYKGKDYTSQITIRHLMSHTSGLPCYLLQKSKSGRKVMEELKSGKDQIWKASDVIEYIKTMPAQFPPGFKTKANYANTNHHLLSHIIENVENIPFPDILSELFKSLELKNTFVINETNFNQVAPFYYKSKVVSLPRFLSNSGYDIASNASDLITITEAFFKGYFFPINRLEELKDWRRVFFPFQYGTGIQKFAIPRWLSPFSPVPDMIGHCGSVGSVAFYMPAQKLYIAGTTNQMDNQNSAFQTMIKIARVLKK